MTMKRLVAFAALLLASTAAYAGDSYSFEVGGRAIHIDAPTGCDSPSCVSISIPGIYESDPKRSKRSRVSPQTDSQSKTDTRTKPDPRPRVEAPLPPVLKTEPSSGTSAAPATTATIAPSAATPAASASPRVGELAPSQPAHAPAAETTVGTAPVSAAVQPQQVPATTANGSATSPLGTWQTEEKEGLIRIEACGANLCGYSVDARTNQNGEKILINMKPVNDTRWTGRIHDPKSGSNYDSTIALQGPDSLRVQGCAFGGLFCGGQTWSRMN
jgi:uncharacterized protein (DUF2147 family)